MEYLHCHLIIPVLFQHIFDKPCTSHLVRLLALRIAAHYMAGQDESRHRHHLLCAGDDEIISSYKEPRLLFQLSVRLQINALMRRHRDIFYKHLAGRKASKDSHDRKEAHL